jgi:4-amino-4-deoxy-L-arabinose transferase-like glycosyltransferase
MDPERFETRNSVHLSILLTIALGIGVYLICTTVLISKDGVTFIEYAQKLATSSANIIRSNDQHPGYPFLIAAGQKIIKKLSGGTSLSDWIYSAQIVTLTCRLLALAALYFVGKIIVGPRQSFWAVLILIFLPKPAGYGSDALSDWPHLLFLAAGFLALLIGAKNEHWWCFGLTGLIAGMGYLIRPECAQLVVYGALWLGLRLFWPKPATKRAHTLLAIVAMLISFAVIAGPYMHFKGGIFPKKHVGEFASQVQSHHEAAAYTAALAAPESIKAFGKLLNNIGNTLVWFFLPFLFIGFYKRFKGHHPPVQETFLLIAFAAVNIIMMIWLYCKYGYMSQRHTLPLVVYTIFYLPLGVETVANWLHDRWTIPTGKNLFMILLLPGILLCLVKLAEPQNYDKKSYTAAAQWLTANTGRNDVIAVPDVRISFYAERYGLRYEGDAAPKDAQYVVRVFKQRINNNSVEKISPQEKLLFTTEMNTDNPVVAVYRQMK